MPLPVMHSFAGYAVYKAAKKGRSAGSKPSVSYYLKTRNWFLFLFCVGTANLADGDFLPGVLAGQAVKYHRIFTHSLLAAFLFSGLATLVCAMLRQFTAKIQRTKDDKLGLKALNPLLHVSRPLSQIFAIVFSAYCTHLMLDILCGEGVPIYWPFDPSHYVLPILNTSTGFAELVHKAGGLRDFIAIFFSRAFVKASSLEFAICFAVWGVCLAIQEMKSNIALRQSVALWRFAQALCFIICFYGIRV